MAKKKKKTPAVEAAASECASAVRQTDPEAIKTDLDPHLQEIILKSREERDLDPSFSESLPDGTVMVDVIAKLNDSSVAVDGLETVRANGKLVTGKVAVTDLERVRANPNVASLKRASKLHTTLQFSVPEMNAGTAQLAAALPSSLGSINGQNVIVGIVDYGCDFRHNNFRKPDGSTRLLFLWDQNGGQDTLSPVGFPYGREFNAAKINPALQAIDPYLALQYDPGEESHGTHVMDIAAGNGRATNRPGVAPAADLIFVNIAHDDLEEDEISTGAPVNFGNSKMLLEAVDYIFAKASSLGKQAVVNISLGTHGGPHDGSTLAEEWFDSLLDTPGRAITISAGNSWMHRSHAKGTVTPAAARMLTWVIHPDDDTTNELEVWYEGPQELAIALTPPGGDPLAPVLRGTTVSLKDQNGEVIGRVIHRHSDPNNQDNHIDVVLTRKVPAGQWSLKLSTTAADGVPFHAWIERDYPTEFFPNRQSKFAQADDDASCTIGSISCGQKTIAVGSYLSGSSTRELSPFTAEGPTRDGRQKPEVSAPGQYLHPYWEQGIRAARSRTQSSVRMSGTSMASPHVAGLIALMMQAAGEPLAVDSIRNALIESARHDPPASGSWHGRYGHGRVDAVTVIAAVTELAPPSPITGLPAPVSANGHNNEPNGEPIHGIIAAIAAAAHASSARIRIQLEVEPYPS